MFCSSVIESYECSTHENWKYLDITRPYSIIYYIIDGTAYYSIDGIENKFKKGYLYILPANTTLSLYENPDNKLFHAYIHAFIFPQVKNTIEINVSLDPFLDLIIKNIRTYIKGEIPQHPNIYTQKLTELLISYISDIQEKHDNSIYSQIKRYIDENYIELFKDNIKLTDVFHYSQIKIDRVFKSVYKVTTKKYCEDLILKYVIKLLSNGYQSSEISIMLNFSSQASFSRFFKNKYGQPPSIILQNNKNKKP